MKVEFRRGYGTMSKVVLTVNLSTIPREGERVFWRSDIYIADSPIFYINAKKVVVYLRNSA